MADKLLQSRSEYGCNAAIVDSEYAALWSPGTSNFAYRLWAKCSAASAVLINAYDSVNQDLAIQIIGGKAYFGISENQVASVNITGQTSINDNKRHLIEVVGDRNGYVHLIVDNVEDAAPVDLSPLAAVDFQFEAIKFANGESASPVTYFYTDQVVFLKGALSSQSYSVYAQGIGSKVVEADIEAVPGVTQACYCEFDNVNEDDSIAWRFLSDGWADGLNLTIRGNAQLVDGGVPFAITITPTAGTGGTIDPDEATVVVFGDDQTFTATPAAGYEVNQWLVDGEVVHVGGLSHTLTNVTADHTISATFSAIARHLCLLADVKTRLGLTDTDFDDIIYSIITGIDGMFDAHVGRPLLMNSADETEYYGLDAGLTRLLLRRYPVISITSLKEASDYDFTAAEELVSNVDYRIINSGLNGIILRLNGPWLSGEDMIRVVYRGGYCGAGQTPAAGEYALPAELREAAIMQAAFIFKRKDDIGLSSISSQGGSIQKFADVELLPLVKQVLDRYKRPSL